MKNLEIKARIDDINEPQILLKKIGAKFINRGRQIDTYYIVPSGKFKLRKFNQKNGNLIFYKRKESLNPKWSNYLIFHISEPDKFNKFLQQIFPTQTIVNKIRIFYRYKNARIHLDNVKNLGKFIEIEAEVKNGELQAKKTMRELLNYLKIPKRDFIKKSYSDLH